jgi:hypothetical protein
MGFKQLDRILQVTPVFIIIVIPYSSLFSLIEAQISNEKPIEFSVNIRAPNFLAYISEEKG